MPLSDFKPEDYDALLARKAERVSAMFTPFKAPVPQIFPSAPKAYRMRAEFRVWHEGGDLDYVMFRRDKPKEPVPLIQFPVACEEIQSLMPQLMAKLRPDPTLRRKLFQVEFLSTLAGDTLVSLIYHRRLDESWEVAARQLAQDLGIALIGRSRKQKIIIERDYVVEKLPVDGREVHYHQYDQSFTQPNGELNITMIEWACAQAEPLSGDLLELYCGNGNFTLPLSRHFDHVIATEVAKTSTRAARENLALNNIDNVQLIRLSAEETSQAMAGQREFRRLADLPRKLSDYDLKTLLVDPPRAGLDEQTASMAAGFEAIIYISCNPLTLTQNLQTLCKTHQIRAFALFDQFPYTEHMECGVFLEAV
jgi:tRNA (uracil-5-)-methyltransferase